MRLPLNLVVLCVAIVPALPLLAAEPQPLCEKDVLLYVDISNSMRPNSGGRVSRLQIFTRALDDLLVRTSEFLAAGDRVRLVTFSGKADVAFDDTMEGDALSRLTAELSRLRSLQQEPDNPISNATDVTLVLRDLEEQLIGRRRTYVILASDLIHDPNNENGENREERKEAFLQRLKDFTLNVPEPLPQIVILNANFAAEPDRDVGATVLDALGKSPLKAEEIPVTGVRSVMPALRRKIGEAMLARIELRSEEGKARLVLSVTNPNAFPVRLLQTKADGKETPVNRLIGCGATESIDISAPPGSRITAEFDVGEGPSTPTAVRDVLDIDARRSRVLLDRFGTGTLLVHAHVRKLLSDDATVEVEVEGQEKKTVSIRKGVADEPVTFAIPLSDDAARLRGEDTVRARFSVGGDIALPKGTATGDKTTYEAEPQRHGDWRDILPRVVRTVASFIILLLLSGPGAVRLFLTKLVEAGILDLLPGPERYLNAGWGAACCFLPAYLMSGGRWTAYVNALPTALLAGLCVFYILRIAAVVVWSRLIEPKDTMLAADIAQERLRTVSFAIWTCTVAAFLAVAGTMASLVPYALAAAQ